MKELSQRYPVWFCDVWGVLHDGVHASPGAAGALARHRRGGGTVLLLTNAPRPAASVAIQLARFGYGPEHFDAVITSGDVTRGLVVDHGGGGVYHIGPERDLPVFQGLDVSRVSLDDAAVAVCTGLFDDETETPEDYAAAFVAMRARGLAMICANPDRMIRRGGKLIFCAGALAGAYAAMGGTVMLAGKPYRPVYERAREAARRLRGAPVALEQVLAIGDGPETDIRGAADYGIAALLIAGGVSESDMPLTEIEARIRRAIPEARIAATRRRLVWED